MPRAPDTRPCSQDARIQVSVGQNQAEADRVCFMILNFVWLNFPWVITSKQKGSNYEGKSKSNGTFKKKHIYYKYTETKLILLTEVTPLDLNAPVF
jgi:hypothetical protein